MCTDRRFLAPDRLTDTQQKILALAATGLSPGEMRDHFPTFQLDSLKKICRHLRKRGYDIPLGSSRPYKLGVRDLPPADPRRATLEHLLDLKRAGHTTFLYRLRCEYRIRPGKGDRALAPPLNYSAMGSPAAMVAAE